jgi:hypothetical protein
MNQFTATFLCMAGVFVIAILMMLVPMPQVVRAALVTFMSFGLVWIVFNKVRRSDGDKDPKL